MGVYTLHRYIRVAEVVVIVGLSVFALLTYRELSALRRFPVSLPSYEFTVSGDPEPGHIVNTRGTWISDRGTPEPLLTTTIECRKARMECTESAAKVVFVGGKGLLESVHTAFEVERWSESEIVTKPAAGPCSTRRLVLDLQEKRAISRVSTSQEKGICKEAPAKTLELVNGYRVRSAPL